MTTPHHLSFLHAEGMHCLLFGLLQVYKKQKAQLKRLIWLMRRKSLNSALSTCLILWLCGGQDEPLCLQE